MAKHYRITTQAVVKDTNDYSTKKAACEAALWLAQVTLCDAKVIFVHDDGYETPVAVAEPPYQAGFARVRPARIVRI